MDNMNFKFPNPRRAVLIGVVTSKDGIDFLVNNHADPDTGKLIVNTLFGAVE